MTPTIRVDEEVFKALQERAKPFVDSPNDVLRRLLSLNGDQAAFSTVRKRRPRLPSGTSTPTAAFRQPILKALAELGGKGRAAEVLKMVETWMAGRLTSVDREWLPQGGDIRWRKKANWERYNMMKDGLVKPISPPTRGTWELTEKGWKEAKA
jgi:hypothetical protein